MTIFTTEFKNSREAEIEYIGWSVMDWNIWHSNDIYFLVYDVILHKLSLSYEFMFEVTINVFKNSLHTDDKIDTSCISGILRPWKAGFDRSCCRSFLNSKAVFFTLICVAVTWTDTGHFSCRIIFYITVFPTRFCKIPSCLMTEQSSCLLYHVSYTVFK